MIALTQEKRQKRINWLNARISSMEEARDEMPFGLSEDEEMELAAYKDSLASLTAEPVAYTSEFALVDVYIGDTAMMGGGYDIGNIPLFTSPPVQEIKLPSRIENIHLRTPLEVEDMWIDRFKRLNGWGE